MSFARNIAESLKTKFNHLLDATIYRAKIERDFEEALREIRQAHAHIPEEEINACIELALAEVRAEQAARDS